MKIFRILPLVMLFTGCSTLDLTEQKTVHVESSDIDIPGKHSTVEIASLPAQLRNAYIWTDESGNRVVCAEPVPDVAASTSLNATANAVNNLTTALNHSIDLEKQRQSNSKVNQSAGGDDGGSSGSDSGSDFSNSLNNSYDANNKLDQSINLGLATTSTMVNLGGRTDIVLLAREMMFANCMASANKQLGTKANESNVQINLTKIYTILDDMVKADRAVAEAKKTQAKANQAQAESNKINAVIKAADKLDPKVLAGIEPAITAQYMQAYLAERDLCIKNANSDPVKIKKCNRDYQRKIKALMDM